MKHAYIIERDELMTALAKLHKDYRHWDEYAEALTEDDTADPEEVQMVEHLQNDSFKEFTGALELLVLAGVFSNWSEGLEAVHDYIYKTR